MFKSVRNNEAPRGVKKGFTVTIRLQNCLQSCVTNNIVFKDGDSKKELMYRRMNPV